jgi:hypothetical protein
MPGVSGAYSIYDPYSEFGIKVILFRFHVKARVEKRWRSVIRREFSLSENTLDNMLLNEGRGRGKPCSGCKPGESYNSVAIPA